jgi:hypothetical protein
VDNFVIAGSIAGPQRLYHGPSSLNALPTDIFTFNKEQVCTSFILIGAQWDVGNCSPSSENGQSETSPRHPLWQENTF